MPKYGPQITRKRRRELSIDQTISQIANCMENENHGGSLITIVHPFISNKDDTINFSDFVSLINKYIQKLELEVSPDTMSNMFLSFLLPNSKTLHYLDFIACIRGYRPLAEITQARKRQMTESKKNGKQVRTVINEKEEKKKVEIIKEEKNIKNEKTNIPDTNKIKFAPGRIGLNFKNNMVSKVFRRCQAFKLGVKNGWRVLEINGLPQCNDTQSIIGAIKKCQEKGEYIEILFSCSKIS